MATARWLYRMLCFSVLCALSTTHALRCEDVSGNGKNAGSSVRAASDSAEIQLPGQEMIGLGPDDTLEFTLHTPHHENNTPTQQPHVAVWLTAPNGPATGNDAAQAGHVLVLPSPKPDEWLVHVRGINPQDLLQSNGNGSNGNTGNKKWDLCVRWNMQDGQAGQLRLPGRIGFRSEATDVVLLMDGSISMQVNDPERLRIAAARDFISSARKSGAVGRIGIVQFDNEARVVVRLTPVTEDFEKALKQIDERGQTDIDGGIRKALEMLAAKQNNGEKPLKAVTGCIILLTDGEQEPGVYGNAHNAARDAGVAVHTLALGREADRKLLKRIASETDGTFSDAATDRDLMRAYSSIASRIARSSTILSASPDKALPQISKITFPVDASCRALAATVTGTSAGMLTLTGPDGHAASNSIQSAQAVVELPAAGQWQSEWKEQTGLGNAEKLPTPAAGVLPTPPPASPSPRLSVTARTSLYPLFFRMEPAEPIELDTVDPCIALSLCDGNQAVSGASVHLEVQIEQLPPIVIDMFDDGAHADGMAGDGIYGAQLPLSQHPATNEAYPENAKGTLKAIVTGTRQGQPFRREVESQFVFRRHDTWHVRAVQAILTVAPLNIDLGGMRPGGQAHTRIHLLTNGPAITVRSMTIESNETPPIASELSSVWRQEPLRLAGPLIRPFTVTQAGADLELAFDLARDADSALAGSTVLAIAADGLREPMHVSISYRVLSQYLEVDAPLAFGRIETGESSSRVARWTWNSFDNAVATPPAPLDALISFVPESTFISASAPELIDGKASARIALNVPADSTPGEIGGSLRLEAGPVVALRRWSATIVRPKLEPVPAALDFGALRPGQRASSQLILNADAAKTFGAELSLAQAFTKDMPPAANPAETQGQNQLPTGSFKLAQRHFELSPGASQSVPLQLAIPNDAEDGIYRGILKISSRLGSLNIPMSVKVANDVIAAPFHIAPSSVVLKMNDNDTAAKLPIEYIKIFSHRDENIPLNLLFSASKNHDGNVPAITRPLHAFMLLDIEGTATQTPSAKINLPARGSVTVALQPGPDASDGESGVLHVDGIGEQQVVEIQIERISRAPMAASPAPTHDMMNWMLVAFTVLIVLVVLVVHAKTKKRWVRFAVYSVLFHLAFFPWAMPRQTLINALPAGVEISLLESQESMGMEMSHEQKRRLDALRTGGENGAGGGDAPIVLAKASLPAGGKDGSDLPEPAASVAASPDGSTLEPAHGPAAEKKAEAPRAQRGALAPLADEPLAMDSSGPNVPAKPVAPDAPALKAVAAQGLPPAKIDTADLGEAVETRPVDRARFRAQDTDIPLGTGSTDTIAAAAPLSSAPAMRAPRAQSTVDDPLALDPAPAAASAPRATVHADIEGAAGRAVSVITQSNQTTVPMDFSPTVEIIHPSISFKDQKQLGESTLGQDAAGVHDGAGSFVASAVSPTARSIPMLPGGDATDDALDAGNIATPISAVSSGNGSSGNQSAKMSGTRGGSEKGLSAVWRSGGGTGTELPFSGMANGNKNGAGGTGSSDASTGRKSDLSGSGFSEGANGGSAGLNAGAGHERHGAAGTLYSDGDGDQPLAPGQLGNGGQGGHGAELAGTGNAAAKDSRNGNGNGGARITAAGAGGLNDIGLAGAGRALAGLGEFSGGRGESTAMPGSLGNGDALHAGMPNDSAYSHGAGGAAQGTGRIRGGLSDGDAPLSAGLGSNGTAAVARGELANGANVKNGGTDGRNGTARIAAAGGSGFNGMGLNGFTGAVSNPGGTGHNGSPSVSSVGLGTGSAFEGLALAAGAGGLNDGKSRRFQEGTLDGDAPLSAGPAGTSGSGGGGKVASMPAPGSGAGRGGAAFGTGLAGAKAGFGNIGELYTQSGGQAGAGSRPRPKTSELNESLGLNNLELVSKNGLSLAQRFALSGQRVITAPGEGALLRVTLGLAKHSADWNSSPTALHNLRSAFIERSGLPELEVKVETIDLADAAALKRCSVVMLTSNFPVVFKPAELAGMQAYIQAGGVIWVNDSTDTLNQEFDVPFRADVPKIIPGGTLVKLPLTHPFFTACYDLRKGYKGFRVPPGDKYRLDYIEAVLVHTDNQEGDRAGIVYTRNDYSDGLEIDPRMNAGMKSLTDLTNDEMLEGSLRFGMNLIAYSLGANAPKAPPPPDGAAEVEKIYRYKGAPLPVLDDFSVLTDKWQKPIWLAEKEWCNDTQMQIGKDPEENRDLLLLRFAGGPKFKAAVTRNASLDLGGVQAVVFDLNSGVQRGLNVSLMFNLKNGKAYETRPVYVRPGWNRNLRFPLNMGDMKSSASPTPWKDYDTAFDAAGGVERMSVLIYNLADGGTAKIGPIELQR